MYMCVELQSYVNSLMAQMLKEVPKDFEGLHADAFTLGGHELVDYPAI